MDEKGICTQVAAIVSYVSNIKTSRDHTSTPGKLDNVDLPAAFTVIGGANRTRDLGHWVDRLADEARTFTIRVYVVPVTQDMSTEKAASFAADFIGLMYDAFDSRPMLVNAAGDLAPASPDYDFAADGINDTFLQGDSGIVIRDYNGIDYFAVEWELMVHGYRETSTKQEGN